MISEKLDEHCLQILETLYRNQSPLGFNEISERGGHNKTTLRKHLDEHLIPKFVEVSKTPGKHKHRLTKHGVSAAFQARLEKYGEVVTTKWAQDWLDNGWEPIDVTEILVKAPEIDMVYLMRNKEKKEAKLIVPPFLDGSVYLRSEEGRELELVPDILTIRDMVLADQLTIIQKLRAFTESNKTTAGLDPGPRYKAFLGTLKEHVSRLRYSGGPFPSAENVEHQEVVQSRAGTKEERVNFLAQELWRDIENPPESGIWFVPLGNIDFLEVWGFYVILNKSLQNHLTQILGDEVKAQRFKRIFLDKLEPFLERCLIESCR